MAHSIPFDTHAYVKKLTAAGVPEPQAEVHAEALAELIDQELGTKRDLAELRLALQRDLAELRVATQRDIEELRVAVQREIEEAEGRMRHDVQTLELRLKHDLTLRFGGMLTAAVAIIAILVKLL
ncbi:MAG: DUF1640 domain-containing protein [Candidatus Lambdaproteobacteria bacterium]|nr:DUF1640 domain-containing protein [Candidatus Lambdaproteobacteria bacterium]